MDSRVVSTLDLNAHTRATRDMIGGRGRPGETTTLASGLVRVSPAAGSGGLVLGGKRSGAPPRDGALWRVIGIVVWGRREIRLVSKDVGSVRGENVQLVSKDVGSVWGEDVPLLSKGVQLLLEDIALSEQILRRTDACYVVVYRNGRRGSATHPAVLAPILLCAGRGGAFVCTFRRHYPVAFWSHLANNKTRLTDLIQTYALQRFPLLPDAEETLRFTLARTSHLPPVDPCIAVIQCNNTE